MNKDNKIPFYVPLLASFINSAILAPLELSATRSKSEFSTHKSFKLLSHVVKTEGILSLWNGCLPFVISTSISRGLWLTTYDYIKPIMSQQHSKNLAIIYSGLFSGAITALVTNPLWNWKTYANLPGYPGFKQTFYKDNMYKLFTAGTKPAVIYISIESAGQLVIYEKLKGIVIEKNINSPIIFGLLGGISKLYCLPFTYPLHVITQRYRENEKLGVKENLFRIISKIKYKNSWYDGMLSYSCRVAPQSTSLFFIYEFFLKMLSVTN